MTPFRCPLRELPSPTLPDGSTLKVIGLGGVGSIVARYLTIYLAALDRSLRLVLVDGDAFEDSNSTRMLFSDCGNKAQVVAAELRERFCGTAVSIEAVEEYLTPDNAGRLISEGDLVFGAVDNHATRKVMSERCSELRNAVLIAGGNDGVGTDEDGRFQRGTMGSVQIQVRRDGVDVTPPLTRFHPEISNPTDRRPDQLSCTEALASQPQMLFTNLMTASCMLGTFLLQVSNGALHFAELAFELADGLMRPVLRIRPTLPA